ncbi:molybdopterin synthase catalytic subunit MoaE [Chitinasiproducens palmae]|uniref:Molybdopterin synthase catalytic subunit n=1 Tax=Chitinasiproducens palmae TaxID=1770053 RepID=A0A1H2PNU4_9BURK|nr:molybdopterin synthase catalytic subunit MoaE [Chitinasiproducens palmae]SDV47523.1 molybdopterin synthase subunit MoaE [Chitinasiproducens palmae]
MDRIVVQAAAFDAGAEIASLREHDASVGAVAAFVGQVRDLNGAQGVDVLELEHYPGMTEASLAAIVADAHARWSLRGVTVIHRVGPLKPCDPIVLVAVASAHRGEAFQACEFVMDFLKTEAPFWKKETADGVSRWVEARERDDIAKQRWQGAGADEATQDKATHDKATHDKATEGTRARPRRA